MEPIKVAILDLYNNHPNQGMRCIKQIVEEQVFPIEWKVFDVRAKNEIPDLSYDVYISSGGPGNPLVGDEEWDRKWTSLMDAIFAHNKVPGNTKKYVFLICHSFQMMINHFKLAEITKRKSTAFGIFPVHKTAIGDDEALLVNLPEPFYAVDSRDYQVIQPDAARMEELGARLLCIEKDRPHVPYERATMGIRFSDEVIGFQFHPEADVFGMNLYFQRSDKKKQVIETHGLKKYEEMLDYLKDKNKIQLTYATVLPGFLRLSMMKLRNFTF
ncbi:MAG: GMP synthase [Bacteroidetes bacterium]|nr:GMP synthase [Bacteroidota bacterium]MBK7389998.1 GMP synthase [Bacteroidota bacterium]MBK9045495.1 GMP synthase [Bacteroidota bacterium]MBK9423775.1 GMP synthase [Bacteroidota bacterium]MBL0072641.1 GMP synthase [Bacteroidota bacterium]